MKALTRSDKLLLVLSIYVVVEIYLRTVLSYPRPLLLWVERIDFLICIIFLSYFFMGLSKSSSKLEYIKANWIDFISSIPLVGILRIGRIVRIIRILRLIRSGNILYRFIDRKNSISTFKKILFLNTIVLSLSTLSVYHLEKGINESINTLGDSFWWCINTVMTIGFVQDIVLITLEGKVFSIILIFSGLLLFGTFISMVTDFFIGDEVLLTELKLVNKRLNEIENKIDQLISQK